jgi:hypothetical protein
MPITMELCENDRVFYYRVSPPAQLSELTPLKARNWEIRDQHPHTIHVIANLTEVRKFPPDILSLRHGSPNMKHPRAGLIFIVSESSYVRSILGIISRVANTNKFRVVQTEAEAWTAVREIIASEIGEPLPSD